MKNSHIVIIGAGVLTFQSGCLSGPIALSPVGPDVRDSAGAGTKGYLQVFTAKEKSIPIASDDPTSFNLHTGYDIKDAAGKSVQFVANHSSNMDEWPNAVKLPAGTYVIVAESTCCGQVTVPVVIEKGKTTVLHLDSNWSPSAQTPTNQLVFLPDGAAVGWSCTTPKSMP